MPDSNQTTARHPCAGRSRAQREAFERIAIGQPPMCSKATIDALRNAGLVEYAGEEYAGRDAMGVFSRPVYEVPLNVHYQWCAWCAENVKDEEDA